MCNAKNEKQGFLSVVRKGTPVALLLILAAVPFQIADAQGRGRGRGNSSQQQQSNRSLGNSSNRQMNSAGSGAFNGTLSQAQLEQLVNMREEEKLAHDVYVALGQSSGLQIFSNISKAESKHMQAVEQLVSRYTSIMPLANMAPGTFSNPQFQKLYAELVAAGTASPIAAVTVGVKIEEMDIQDLQVLLSQNPPQQVARVLENLQRASGNHLRAFMGQLQSMGGTYTPEFLDKQVFNNIVNSSGAQGSGQSGNGRMGMQMQGGKGKMGGRR